jgi:hypothetical protein
MLKPNPVIVRKLKTYDNKLSVKWNNEYHYWEIWRREATGNKRITPIVEAIYNIHGDNFKFVPLDNRIVDWISNADHKRTPKNWRKLNKKKYLERIERRDRKTREKFANIAKDNYNVINPEIINPLLEDSDWVAPDCGTSKSRVMMRTGENVRKARGEE